MTILVVVHRKRASSNVTGRVLANTNADLHSRGLHKLANHVPAIPLLTYLGLASADGLRLQRTSVGGGLRPQEACNYFQIGY
jgi:hypothetical protein